MASFFSQIPSNCWYQISVFIYFIHFIRWIPLTFKRITDRATKSHVVNDISTSSALRNDMVVYF